MGECDEFKKATKSGCAVVMKIRSLRSDIEKIQDRLREMKSDVEEFHENCNLARTAGTTVNCAAAAVGIAGAMALFTGGLSLPLTFVAAGCTAAGTACNVITDSIDRDRTDECVSDIKRWLESVQDGLKKVDELMADYSKKLAILMDKCKTDATFYERAKKYYKKFQVVKNPAVAGGYAIECAIALRMWNIVKIMKSAGNLTRTASGGMTYTITSASLSVAQKEAINKFAGFGGQLVGTTGKWVTRGVIAVSVVASVIEVVSLINSWNSEHPTVEPIRSAMKKLNEVDDKLEELADVE